uniref:Uncharacterized protein n=1 Tax=Chromera velia CCMP2878 TaxID=1169474 RepID=A0A0G4G902_9ALVE|eukprot:Cvel_20778.t1-p1 / transcript=Cvel_20778.t1 / gene=Cvel_20778 / organism=Chromera_velia_CCMP2878 / gene_product=hypothetical protein / transcript_product=hypothetical protein / location=Cvel_scaffold1896:9514-15295(-) / protein_length=1287 / sequence_SO=supercontig / SO=protein_coding / is_pseudo=false
MPPEELRANPAYAKLWRDATQCALTSWIIRKSEMGTEGVVGLPRFSKRDLVDVFLAVSKLPLPSSPLDVIKERRGILPESLSKERALLASLLAKMEEGDGDRNRLLIRLLSETLEDRLFDTKRGGSPFSAQDIANVLWASRHLAPQNLSLPRVLLETADSLGWQNFHLDSLAKVLHCLLTLPSSEARESSSVSLLNDRKGDWEFGHETAAASSGSSVQSVDCVDLDLCVPVLREISRQLWVFRSRRMRKRKERREKSTEESCPRPSREGERGGTMGGADPDGMGVEGALGGTMEGEEKVLRPGSGAGDALWASLSLDLFESSGEDLIEVGIAGERDETASMEKGKGTGMEEWVGGAGKRMMGDREEKRTKEARNKKREKVPACGRLERTAVSIVSSLSVLLNDTSLDSTMVQATRGCSLAAAHFLASSLTVFDRDRLRHGAMKERDGEKEEDKNDNLKRPGAAIREGEEREADNRSLIERSGTKLATDLEAVVAIVQLASSLHKGRGEVLEASCETSQISGRKEGQEEESLVSRLAERAASRFLTHLQTRHKRAAGNFGEKSEGEQLLLSSKMLAAIRLGNTPLPSAFLNGLLLRLFDVRGSVAKAQQTFSPTLHERELQLPLFPKWTSVDDLRLLLCLEGCLRAVAPWDTEGGDLETPDRPHVSLRRRKETRPGGAVISQWPVVQVDSLLEVSPVSFLESFTEAEDKISSLFSSSEHGRQHTRQADVDTHQSPPLSLSAAHGLGICLSRRHATLPFRPNSFSPALLGLHALSTVEPSQAVNAPHAACMIADTMSSLLILISEDGDYRTAGGSLLDCRLFHSLPLSTLPTKTLAKLLLAVTEASMDSSSLSGAVEGSDDTSEMPLPPFFHLSRDLKDALRVRLLGESDESISETLDVCTAAVLLQALGGSLRQRGVLGDGDGLTKDVSRQWNGREAAFSERELESDWRRTALKSATRIVVRESAKELRHILGHTGKENEDKRNVLEESGGEGGSATGGLRETPLQFSLGLEGFAALMTHLAGACEKREEGGLGESFFAVERDRAVGIGNREGVRAPLWALGVTDCCGWKGGREVNAGVYLGMRGLSEKDPSISFRRRWGPVLPFAAAFPQSMGGRVLDEKDQKRTDDYWHSRSGTHRLGGRESTEEPRGDIVNLEGLRGNLAHPIELVAREVRAGASSLVCTHGVSRSRGEFSGGYVEGRGRGHVEPEMEYRIGSGSSEETAETAGMQELHGEAEIEVREVPCLRCTASLLQLKGELPSVRFSVLWNEGGPDWTAGLRSVEIPNIFC